MQTPLNRRRIAELARRIHYLSESLYDPSDERYVRMADGEKRVRELTKPLVKEAVNKLCERLKTLPTLPKARLEGLFEESIEDVYREWERKTPEKQKLEMHFACEQQGYKDEALFGPHRGAPEDFDTSALDQLLDTRNPQRGTTSSIPRGFDEATFEVIRYISGISRLMFDELAPPSRRRL